MTKRQMKFHIFVKLTVVTMKYFFKRFTSMFPIQHIFSEKKTLLLATTYSSMLLVSLHLPVLSSYIKNVHFNITWTSFYFQDFFRNCLPAYHSKPRNTPTYINKTHFRRGVDQLTILFITTGTGTAKQSYIIYNHTLWDWSTLFVFLNTFSYNPT